MFKMQGATTLRPGRNYSKHEKGTVHVKCGDFVKKTPTIIRFYGEEMFDKMVGKRATIIRIRSRDKSQIGFIIGDEGAYAFSTPNEKSHSIEIKMRIREAEMMFKNLDGDYDINHDEENDIYYIELNRRLNK